MEKSQKKINIKGLSKFSICEMLSFMELNDLLNCLHISKGFRNSIIYYIDLYVRISSIK